MCCARIYRSLFILLRAHGHAHDYLYTVLFSFTIGASSTFMFCVVLVMTNTPKQCANAFFFHLCQVRLNQLSKTNDA